MTQIKFESYIHTNLFFAEFLITVTERKMEIYS